MTVRDLTEACQWPHHVDSLICVYDRDSYDRYQSGEYQLPTRCICGASLVYDKPVCIALIEGGQMTGEIQLELEFPLTLIKQDLRDSAEHDEC